MAGLFGATSAMAALREREATGRGREIRVGLFENVNGFPVPYLRIRVYNEFDRAGAVEAIRDYLGLGASGEQP